MDFFTRDEHLVAEICEVLAQTGCCSRCILRYAGLKDMFTFRGDTKEMDCLVSKLRNKKASGAEKASSDNCMANKAETAITEASVEQTVKETKTEETAEVNETTKKVDETTEEMEVAKKLDETTEEMETTNSSDCGGIVNESAGKSNTNSKDKLENGKAELDQTINRTKKDVPTEQKNWKSQYLDITSTCVVCLGVLEEFTSEDFLYKIKSEVTENGFVFSTYFCSLMLPVCVSLREYHSLDFKLAEGRWFYPVTACAHALILFLKEKFISVYGEKKYTDIATVKDVWKWKSGPVLKNILDAPFDTKSPFEITLTFSYKNSDKECNFLLSSGLDTFRQRKMDRRHRKKASFAVFTRANVASAIETISSEEFKKSYVCPPAAPSCSTVCDIKCQNEAVFIAGRYNKYSRVLSQTPWMIEGVRKSESSVEELLCQEINKNFKPKEVRFSSSGREDVDVLMLGDGRPFVLELINPCKRDFSQQELNEMQSVMNSSTTDIACRDLQIVIREEVDVLKQGEIDKVKKYRALCWTKEPVTDDQLKSLAEIKDLTILQKTPIRVLHRRPLSTRDKTLHSMSVSRMDQHHFSVDLSTQAGTYIKEFVHGDLGRTRPNMSTLLGTDCDILELDVTAVELDWPKKIHYKMDEIV